MVRVVQTVPVDLAVSLRRCPELISCVPVGKALLCAVCCVSLVPNVIVAARHVLPVVGVGVVSIVIVEFGALIHAVFSHQRCCELGVVVYFPVPSQQCCRSIVVYDTRVTFLSVLISPIRVIVAVVGQPVHLVCSGALRCTLSRVTPCNERE